MPGRDEGGHVAQALLDTILLPTRFPAVFGAAPLR
jgi:hypothetical protein